MPLVEIPIDQVRAAFGRHRWLLRHQTRIVDRWGDRYWMIVSDPAGNEYTATISEGSASIAPRNKEIPLPLRAVRRRGVRRSARGKVLHSVAESVDILVAEVNSMPTNFGVQDPEPAPVKEERSQWPQLAMSVMGLLCFIGIPIAIALIYFLWK